MLDYYRLVLDGGDAYMDFRSHRFGKKKYCSGFIANVSDVEDRQIFIPEKR